MTPRTRRVALVALVLAAGPPVLSRLIGDLSLPGVGRTFAFNDLIALTLGIAVCFAVGAIGLNLLMGYAGQISLGHAAFLGIGAYASGLMTARALEAPWLVGMLAAGVSGGVVALVLGLPALRLRGLYLAIVTIAVGLSVQETLFLWQPLSGGSAGLELPKPRAGEFVFSREADYLALLLLIFLIVWVVDENMLRSKVGRAFHGIREDELVAQSFGVDVTRYKLLAFVVSGVMSGIAGGMLGHLVTFVNSQTFRYEVSLSFVVIVVIGGLGSRIGVVLAAIGFAALPRIFGFLEGWADLAGALALMHFMSRNPGGIAGAQRDRRERRAVRDAKRSRDTPDPDELPKLPSLPRPATSPERAVADPSGPLLEVSDVSVRFGGVQALKNASLEVPRGKIVGLIGPNGAGKTTLFNTVSGFVRQDAGRIRFLGREIHDLAPHARARLGIGRTFQLIGLATNLSVLENFLLAQHVWAEYGVASALAQLPKATRVEKELRDRSLHVLEALGFERFADVPVKHLSHGQKRLVELGCALVTAPELVMLDEPSAGMAPAAAESLAQRLRELRAEFGRTVLLIEHNVPLVLDVCDYVYVLNFGQILAHGPTEDIAKQPAVLAAYLGEAPARAVSVGTGAQEKPRVSEQAPRVSEQAPVLLEATDVRAGFGSNAVLHGVSFRVHEGEIAAVLGLNGAGKSVTLGVVDGTVPAWSGRVRLGNVDITHLASAQRVAKGMAHVPQGRRIFPDLTVEQNLRLGAYVLLRRDKARYADVLESVLDRFPVLGERKGQMAGTLSGGEQAMLAVSRALMSQPRLILVDEPSTGLAPAMVRELVDILREANRTGVSIVLVEQNVTLSLDIAHRAYIMQRGQIVYAGDVPTLDRTKVAGYLGIGALVGSRIPPAPHPSTET